jgi:hypothetical protein
MKKITLSRETYRGLLKIFPLCSDRFIENVLIILLNQGGRSDVQFDRRLWLTLYRSGVPLKQIAQTVIETGMDDKNFELLFRSLLRNSKEEKDRPDPRVVICYLDGAGKLSHCTDREASEQVNDYLKARGVPHKFTLGAYQKCVTRLRRIGVKLSVSKHA